MRTSKPMPRAAPVTTTVFPVIEPPAAAIIGWQARWMARRVCDGPAVLLPLKACREGMTYSVRCTRNGQCMIGHALHAFCAADWVGGHTTGLGMAGGSIRHVNSCIQPWPIYQLAPFDCCVVWLGYGQAMRFGTVPINTAQDLHATAGGVPAYEGDRGCAPSRSRRAQNASCSGATEVAGCRCAWT
jgi:hypothetical protein